jgi:hypothetical protein
LQEGGQRRLLVGTKAQDGAEVLGPLAFMRLAHGLDLRGRLAIAAGLSLSPGRGRGDRSQGQDQ